MKIKIIPNPKKDWAKTLAKEVKSFLSPTHQIVSRGADATICIGGDGTILYTNYKGKVEGTVLGIGSVNSYICQLRSDNWKEKIHSILGSGKTLKVLTLKAEVGGSTFSALNDFVIHATHYRVAELDVIADGTSTSYEGDGIILSTSIGSTGYAYSAGGEKLAPSERKISVVPICPYRRAFLPKTFSQDQRVSIKVGSDCAFILDGIFIRKLKKGESVNVSKGEDLVFFSGVGESWNQ